MRVPQTCMFVKPEFRPGPHVHYRCIIETRPFTMLPSAGCFREAVCVVPLSYAGMLAHRKKTTRWGGSGSGVNKLSSNMEGSQRVPSSILGSPIVSVE